METNLLFNEPYSKLAHDNYPLLLGASKYCPKQLFCKGTLPTNDKIGIAMVGTRRPSASAEELCRRLVESLRSTNAVVISGLAQGIDSFCHRAALDAGIPTIAVLAQGLDAKIEGERNTLAKRILDAGGALLSEYEGDTPAYKGNFIARNRIISGLSQSTLVVQSRKKGGALLTAQFSLDEGKPLLACPGNFDCELYSGTNALLDLLLRESRERRLGCGIAHGAPPFRCHHLQTKKWCPRRGANSRPFAPEANALIH